MTDPRDAELITQSLETAAERAGDLTTTVYARLFRERPELEPLFVMDTDGAVRGEMLSRVFGAILDFIGPRAYAQNWISAEATNHDGYLVPRADFMLFFGIVRDVVRDACGDAWTDDVNRAWTTLLSELEFYISG